MKGKGKKEEVSKTTTGSTTKRGRKSNLEKAAESVDSTPLVAGETALASAQTTRSRRNKASGIHRSDRFKNIEDGVVPFNYVNKSNLSIRDTVTLCQKAYYNFAIFRNTIDLMTEFSVSNISFRGGNKKSRDFFEAYFRKINIWEMQDKFFREYYRSGNVFVYRFDAKLKDRDIKKITQTFGGETYASSVIPVRYVILNPADIQAGGSISFAAARYYKEISDYELARLRNPVTDEDKEVLESLDKATRDLIKSGRAAKIVLPLEEERISAVFYKKQDYEPFSVPFGYPVLEDINWKSELKKMDMAITRTMQQAILLVTMGAEPEKGGVNQKNLQIMQEIFQNESIGRVLVADYTTDAKFVIPDIANLLDPKKYEVVNQDILIGLNNVLFGSGEKFANQSTKVEVFIARLRQARQAFLSNFLLPEIKRISKELGFRKFPMPEFEKISLKDDTNISRIYNRLVEIGVLTPEEGIEAIETGRLPYPEESLESQKEHKKNKEKGLYEPIMGGPHTQEKLADMKMDQQESAPKTTNEVGRPEGTGTPQTTKNVSPIGQGSINFSLSCVTENVNLANKLVKSVESQLRVEHGIKRLNKKQKEVAESIAELIVVNEEPKDWTKKVKAYVKKPVDQNLERVEKVQEIAVEHQVNTYLAGILYASKK
tara:strand:- start:342 stop:2315 length:1974 start_codon:yes stop_codon:yes gene_type:complete